MANLHKFTVQEALNRPTEALSSVLTADGQVKATAGSVLAVMVSVNGVTAADKIEIKNSADNSGTALLSFFWPQPLNMKDEIVNNSNNFFFILGFS